MKDSKYKYMKYKLRYNKLKEHIKNFQNGGNLDNKLEENFENLNNDSQIKNIIKMKDYNNRYIYKNNKDDLFIENLNLEPVNNKQNSSNYHKINNYDDILDKFTSNEKFYKKNDEIRVLNYKDDEILFEVFSKK